MNAMHTNLTETILLAVFTALLTCCYENNSVDTKNLVLYPGNCAGFWVLVSFKMIELMLEILDFEKLLRRPGKSLARFLDCDGSRAYFI